MYPGGGGGGGLCTDSLMESAGAGYLQRSVCVGVFVSVCIVETAGDPCSVCSWVGG